MHDMTLQLTLIAAALVNQCDSHGLMLVPTSRNAREGLLTWGGSMWFSNGCTIGCTQCNQTAPIPAHAGDLCPQDPDSGKVPTLNDPALKTFSRGGTINGTEWTRWHPWRKPGSVPPIDACGVAGGADTNHSYPAGGFGPQTGYPQGFPGSRLPPVPDRAVWFAGESAEVAWVPVANHGGGYQYSLCPAEETLAEECFHRTPLGFVNDSQWLRYLYVNDTSNQTQVEIRATRTKDGTTPEGSVWTKNPIPCGTFAGKAVGGNGMGNANPPQFDPPQGCDQHCWGYQPCNVFWTHPSWEGWNKTHQSLPDCATELGEGCCHTEAYMAVVDKVRVPDNIPEGDYVLRWRWDCEQSAQIWAGCSDITIERRR